MLVVGRFINGICVGICSAQVPVYVAELALAHKGGLVVGAPQWAITWAIFITFYISYGCSFLEGTASFRAPWALQTIPVIFFFFGIFWMPESPRWLAKQDRWDKCQKILMLIHADNNPDDDLVRMELQRLREACDMDRIQSNVSFTELVKPPMLWRFHIGVFVQIWSQLTCINVIMYCE
jgi:MFS family permease